MERAQFVAALSSRCRLVLAVWHRVGADQNRDVGRHGHALGFEPEHVDRHLSEARVGPSDELSHNMPVSRAVEICPKGCFDLRLVVVLGGVGRLGQSLNFFFACLGLRLVLSRHDSSLSMPFKTSWVEENYCAVEMTCFFPQVFIFSLQEQEKEMKRLVRLGIRVTRFPFFEEVQ